jgi:hypothetical protein
MNVEISLFLRVDSKKKRKRVNLCQFELIYDDDDDDSFKKLRDRANEGKG